MRNKIHKSMLVVICTTLFAVMSIMLTLFYIDNLQGMKAEIQQETAYIETALNVSGTIYLEDMDMAQVDTRLTLIDKDGSVLYDSKGGEYQMQSHAYRSEIQSALRNGTGEALRDSSTVGKKAYYYAVRLDNGTVLRVSKNVDSIFPIFLSVIPLVLIVFIVMVVFAYYLSKWQTEILIRPINELNLEVPLENDIYEELKPLLISMEHQIKAKEEVTNMRKEFSANVSHELKTPLTSISGYAEIMKSGIVKTEDMGRFADKIYQEASRLIVLIEDIIKLSKLDEKQVPMEKEIVNLYEMCCEIANRLSFSAVKRNVNIEISGENIFYMGIKQVLDEMIYNICENAIKYNVEAGTVKIWIGNTLNGAKVIIEDTGIGIPEEDLERIFERFYRVDKSHSKETGGTGLGLSIAKHGAILHGVEIHVESKIGKGTKMEIVF